MRLSAEIISVSDVHVRMPDDERHRQLMSLFAAIDTKACRCLVLVGDIFDFCFGPNRYCRMLFADLGKELSRLAAAGVRVVFLEGNHEFAMHEIGWVGVEFVKADTFMHRLSDGRKIGFIHGDLIAAPKQYLAFRRFIKSSFVAFICEYLLPHRWFYERCLKFASYSRGHDQYRVLDHARILGGAEERLKQEQVDVLVFGHFHAPYYSICKDGRLISCESWDDPNALLFAADAEPKRARLSAETNLFETLPVRIYP